MTYDDGPTKVSYLDPASAPGPYPTTTATAKVSENKVVLSRGDSSPGYPDGGCLVWMEPGPKAT